LLENKIIFWLLNTKQEATHTNSDLVAPNKNTYQWAFKIYIWWGSYHKKKNFRFCNSKALLIKRDRRGRDRTVVGITIILCNQCQSPLQLSRGVLDTTLCDKVCQWLAAGRCFSPGTQVSSSNKTDRHDITEILLTVAFNTITITMLLKKYKKTFWRFYEV